VQELRLVRLAPHAIPVGSSDTSGLGAPVRAGAVFQRTASTDTPSHRLRKEHVMSKRENDANNAFRPSDSPLTEHEKDQIAARKNLERLRAERLAREAEQKDRRKS
jgi:hypothetical protein